MLPDIVLDDRRFQDLVSEARTRISRVCPEWTEHNVSDPGIALIELFAWMTEMLIYRTNRIPDKLHVALLNLIGVSPEGATCATADVRFTLGGPADQTIVIPETTTEVATVRTSTEPAIVFQVAETFTIEPQRPVAYLVERRGKVKDVGVEDGRARPTPAEQAPFGNPPRPGDALMIGFHAPISRLVVRVDVDLAEARGAGVDPTDPPLRWQVSTRDGGWSEAEVLTDTTGGFNLGSGSTTLQLPELSGEQSILGYQLHWLRCRVDEHTRSGSPAAYTTSPVIRELAAAPVGALVPTAHAVTEHTEVLGTSEGLPGGTFRLRHSPVMEPGDAEFLEVREPNGGDWSAWELCESFAGSGPHDCHYTLDLINGEIELGPAIRQPDGHWRQYGAVPPAGSELRFSRYRHGGGSAGNVKEGTITVLKNAIPGVAAVDNPRSAAGGVDSESLDSVRRRAALEFRTRNRAVTAEDFEVLCATASPQVARAICVADDDGVINVQLLPLVDPADRLLTIEELTPSDETTRDVAAYLDRHRLIGTTIRLVPPRLRALSIVTSVQVSRHAELERVEEDVRYALYCYLNPLIGGTADGFATSWEYGRGWEYGRALNQGELFGVVHAVRGVEFVKILRIYDADLTTLKPISQQPAGTHIELEPDQLIASGTHTANAEYANA
jgi:predicted phage baseplate assembly protein